MSNSQELHKLVKSLTDAKKQAEERVTKAIEESRKAREELEEELHRPY